jgi:OOP family OmpA-OmpF porin
MKALLAIMLSFLTLWSAAFAVEGYVTDGSGQIVKTGSGLCLHTGSFTAANAVEGCDFVAKTKSNPVVLSSDVLFEFNSAVITTKGKVALDQLSKQIKTTDTLSIVGHADRIGSATYNQRLSSYRADAVAMYLDSKVKALYVTTGVGSTQPTEGTKLCDGLKSQEKLIKCLSPDRRVVISFSK